MTTPTATLRALRARVLEGQGADRDLDLAISDALLTIEVAERMRETKMFISPNLTTSLDALRELQRRVLPDFKKAILQFDDEFSIGLASVDVLADPETIARHPDECRAWLAAILSAKIAEAEAA